MLRHRTSLNPLSLLASSRLQALAHESPLQAVRRYESGGYATNDDCTKSYIKALVLSDRLRQTSLSRILPAAGAGHSSSWGNNNLSRRSDPHALCFAVALCICGFPRSEIVWIIAHILNVC